MIIAYEDIYSKFYRLMDDPTFFTLSKNDAYEIMRDWLHLGVSEPYIKKAFSSISFDDEINKLSCELNHSDVNGNENNDKDFVISIFAQYMLISWKRPKIDNALNLSMIVGGKEDKVLKDNLNINAARLNAQELALIKKINSYGYLNNSYLDGDS